MKITKRQLRKLISESVDNIFSFPAGRAKQNRLQTLRNKWISMYSDDDPSMANEGINSWVEQVSNAVNAVDIMVGDDLELFEVTTADEIFVVPLKQIKYIACDSKIFKN